MTTTAAPPDAARARHLAQALLERANLAVTVDPGQALAVLTKTLEQHPPPGSKHGRLVLNALIPREGRYSPAEAAVRSLVRRGCAPTRAAVAGVLRQGEESTQAWAERRARLRPLAEEQGPAAADAVEALWRARGRAPAQSC